MRTLCFVGLLSLAVLAGCAQPSAQSSSEIAARAESWEERFNAGDLDGVVELYTEDAMLLPPNAEMGRGEELIRRHFQPLIDAGVTGSLETTEAISVGDLGYRVGTYTLNAPDGSVADRGKYIEIWRRVDGEWKIARDIYNSDLSPAPAGTLLVATHQVENPAVWLAAWQDDGPRHGQFAEHGAPSVRVFQSPDDAARTGLLVDVVDMEAFQAFLASEEGTAAKAEDGVKDDTLRILVEVK